MNFRHLLILNFAAVAMLSPTLCTTLETARMALPDGFRAQAEMKAFSGFGGYNKGNWRLDAYQGEFTRGESRLGVFDPLYVSNKAKGSFTFTGAEGDDPVAGTCQMRRKSVTIGIVTFDPKKMSYDCDFRRAGQLTGDRLALGQPKPAGMKARLLANDTRVGEAIIRGQHFTMKSVHDYEGSRFGSQSPVGYLVEVDGETVAAVELTDWNPTVYLRSGVDAVMQDSVLVVALAIAVLRDPANSALED